jgi:hypothetical protein
MMQSDMDDLNFAKLSNDSVPVTLGFDLNRVIGKAFLSREGDLITAQVEIEDESLSEDTIKSLTPAVMGQFPVDGEKEFEILKIALGLWKNEDKRILSIGNQLENVQKETDSK